MEHWKWLHWRVRWHRTLSHHLGSSRTMDCTMEWPSRWQRVHCTNLAHVGSWRPTNRPWRSDHCRCRRNDRRLDDHQPPCRNNRFINWVCVRQRRRDSVVLSRKNRVGTELCTVYVVHGQNKTANRKDGRNAVARCAAPPLLGILRQDDWHQSCRTVENERLFSWTSDEVASRRASRRFVKPSKRDSVLMVITMTSKDAIDGASFESDLPSLNPGARSVVLVVIADDNRRWRTSTLFRRPSRRRHWCSRWWFSHDRQTP